MLARGSGLSSLHSHYVKDAAPAYMLCVRVRRQRIEHMRWVDRQGRREEHLTERIRVGLAAFVSEHTRGFFVCRADAEACVGWERVMQWCRTACERVRVT